jgi:hypothetical protein
MPTDDPRPGSEAKRFRFWIPIGIAILAALLVGIVAFDQWIKAAEPRRWEDMRRTCDAMAREAFIYDPQRPVLRGTPQPGNGWEDYEAALALLKAGWKGSLAREFLEGSPKSDPSKVPPWVESFAPALTKLRAGASKGIVERRVDWHGGQSAYVEADRLASLAACQARLLREAGRTTDAAELLLDAALFGEDFARTGLSMDSYAAMSILGTVFDELRLIMLSAETGSEELRGIARELDILDRGFPKEAEASRKGVPEGGGEYLGVSSVEAYLTKLGMTDHKKLSTWRYGFSERIMMVDAFELSLAAHRLYEPVADGPWPEAHRVAVQITADFSRSRNPLVQTVMEIQRTLSNGGPRNAFRERHAQARLLRTAAHYRATGEFLELDDPFGAKLLRAEKGGSLKLWSVGPDGVDDGGLGEWQPQKGKDIVLEVER